MKKTDVKDGFLGLCVGDAMGIPVKYLDINKLKADPVNSMIGYGTFNQPPGTWSDESSLCFCLAESLSKGFDLNDILEFYSRWFYEAYWTPAGKVFDVGPHIYKSISRIRGGELPPVQEDLGGFNGSFVNILPLAYYSEARGWSINDRITRGLQVASLLHRENVAGSVIYLEYAFNLINGQGLTRAYENMCETIYHYFDETAEDLVPFRLVLSGEVYKVPFGDLSETGSFARVLEIGFRSLLNNHSYRDAVLAAINGGGETDVLGALTGSLAGIYYGCESIPHNWVDHLVRHDEIIELAEEINTSFFN